MLNCRIPGIRGVHAQMLALLLMSTLQQVRAPSTLAFSLSVTGISM